MKLLNNFGYSAWKQDEDTLRHTRHRQWSH